MFKRLVLLVIFFSTSLLFAKSYTIHLLLDAPSKVYLPEIKSQAKALFGDADKLYFQIQTCENNCHQKLLSAVKKVALLEQENFSKQYKKSSLITHDAPTKQSDVNRLVRTVAMAIYELYKEQEKPKNVALKSQALSNSVPQMEEVRITSGIERSGTLLGLPEALELAQKNNLNIQQNHNAIRLHALNVNEAKSFYLPTIDIYANHIQIDKDRAKYGAGVYVQGQSHAGVKLTQLIYSDQVIKNIEIRKKLFEGTKYQVKADNEEVLYGVVLRYLTIIQVKNYIEIIRHQKGFIEQNLNFAQQRYRVGATAKSDFLRWQSELANINSTLEDTLQQLVSLKIELATLLQIDHTIDVENYSIQSPLFQLLNQEALSIIQHQGVKDFFQEEMIENHPRLQHLDKLVKVEETSLKMRENEHYLPTVALEGDAYRILERHGEGSNYPFPTDDNIYQAVLNVNLPIYEGGRKSIHLQQDKVDIMNLKLKTLEAKSTIMENLRKHYDGLHRAAQRINFAQQSQQVSQESLALIQERYQNGIDNIITLLDAQNTYTIAQHNHNIAVVDYLNNLSSIYFFAGEITLLSDPKHKALLETQLQQHIHQ